MSLISDFSSSAGDRMKLRLMLGAVVLLVIFTVTACNETRYAIWGKTVSAKADKVLKVTSNGRYGTESDNIRIEYSFPDSEVEGAGTRKEQDDIPITFLDPQQVANDGVVDVQYIPGALEYSRIAGHTRRWLIWPFLVCAGVVAFFGIRFWRDFKEHERRSNATSALYKR